MIITPLDSWVKTKTFGDLASYQLSKLNETLKTAQNGSYYRQSLPQRINSLSELQLLPTIDSKTLKSDGTGLVCVPQDEISRIVTLSTSGSTGEPKRVYFTECDQELTVDYFANGLPTVARMSGIMAILLPCDRLGGVGDLIARALERIPVTPVRHGLVSDLFSCACMLRDSGADSLVGAPVQALAVARYCEAANIKTKIKKVLLSTDNVPKIVRDELKRIWACEVYEHYGMTEMGLGGAIDCDAHEGCHIRENDLLFEILDKNGDPVPDGAPGEVTFSTLTRRGMPFIRYRTGDVSKIIPGRCACGSDLRRVATLTGRIDGCMPAKMRKYDEVLFSLPAVSDFTIIASPRTNSLRIEIDTQKSIGGISASEITATLEKSGLLGNLKAEIEINSLQDRLKHRSGKRVIRIFDS